MVVVCVLVDICNYTRFFRLLCVFVVMTNVLVALLWTNGVEGIILDNTWKAAMNMWFL
jgi:hypothetical protein